MKLGQTFITNKTCTLLNPFVLIPTLSKSVVVITCIYSFFIPDILYYFLIIFFLFKFIFSLVDIHLLSVYMI